MSRTARRRTRAALAGLVLGAGLLGPLVARAQTSTTTATETTAARDCVDLGTREELRFEFCGPPEQRSTDADYPLTVVVANTGRNVFGDFAVTRVELRIATTLDDQQVPDPSSKAWTGQARQASVDWIPSFTTNGTYDLEIVAEGNRPGPSGQRATAEIPIQLAVAPRAPADVKADPSADGSVTVTWSNELREPDTLYYEVSRAAAGGSSFQQLDVVEATVERLVDTPPAGSWRYRVTALRRGATADDGVPSAPATTSTIEVAAPAEPASSANSDGTTGTTAAGSSSGTGARSTTSTTARPSISNGTRSTVDLSNFASGLGGRRTPTTVRRVEPDPGFSETLPFDVDAEAPETEPSTPPLEIAEAPEALGEELISDDGERRRSLGFVAFGLLLFVLGMTGLFLKSEVRRADELEAIDDDAAEGPGLIPSTVEHDVAPAAAVPVTPVAAAPTAAAPTAAVPVVAAVMAEPAPAPATAPASAPAPAPETAPAPAAAPLPSRRRNRADARASARAQRAAELAELFGEEPPSTADDDDRHLAALAASLEADRKSARPDRRVRRTVAPIDAPGLDVPDPVATPSTTRTAAHARRAPTRLPSRPADDRREGGAAVRAGRRGAGQGHRRVPLG